MIFTTEIDEVGLPIEASAKVSECFICKNDIDELDIKQDLAFENVEIQRVKKDGLEIEDGEVIKVDLCHFCKSNLGKSIYDEWMKI